MFPDVEYCVCTKHLLSNLKLHFKDPLLDKYFFCCAYAYTYAYKTSICAHETYGVNLFKYQRLS